MCSSLYDPDLLIPTDSQGAQLGMQPRNRGCTCTPLDSTRNIISNGGMLFSNCDVAEAVMVFADQCSRVAECPSLMTTWCWPRARNDRADLEPASFM